MSGTDYPIPEPVRLILFPLALFYWGVIWWRNFFYRTGFFVSRRLPCKVISVGNLTTGGTGKTPAVIAFATILKTTGKSVAILSRGYRRQTTGTILVTDGNSAPPDWMAIGDEPALMAKALRDIPIAVDENRYRGGSFLVQKFNPDIILLDDAFQHRAIERDVDIVLVNSGDKPDGHKLLPYGKLREPWHQLKRADLVFLTKTNLIKPAPLLIEKLNYLGVAWYSSTMETVPFLIGLDDEKRKVTDLNRKRVLAVSAIGDPKSFYEIIKLSEAYLVDRLSFRDHHVYTENDITQIITTAKRNEAELIITTEKDLLKLKTFQNRITKEKSNPPVYAFSIRFTPSQDGKNTLLQLIES